MDTNQTKHGTLIRSVATRTLGQQKIAFGVKLLFFSLRLVIVSFSVKFLPQYVTLHPAFQAPDSVAQLQEATSLVIAKVTVCLWPLLKSDSERAQNSTVATM